MIICLLLTFTIALFGCTPVDAALWAAVERTDEAYTSIARTVEWNVDIQAPLVSGSEYNYDTSSADVVDFIKLLANDMRLEANTLRSGGAAQTDIKLSKPDLRLMFRLWSEETQRGSRLIFKVPSLFISPAVREKDYLVWERGDALDGAAEAQKRTVESVKALGKYIFSELGPLVGEAEVTAEGNVYTVRLDGAALRRVTGEALAALSSDKGKSLLADIFRAQYGSEQTRSPRLYDDTAAGVVLPEAVIEAHVYELAAEIALYGDAIADQIEKSGLMKNGLTVRYTVNSEGLIAKVESEMTLDFDVEAVSLALDNISLILDGEEPVVPEDKFGMAGSFSVTAKSTSVYGYAPTEVSLPEITEENSVDLLGEYAEYEEYEEALAEWSRKTQAYVYAYELPESGRLKVKNLANGLETEVTAIVNDEGIYNNVFFPIGELAPALGADVEWDPDLMAAIVRLENDGEKTALVLPNKDGERLYDLYFDGFHYDENGDYVNENLTEAQIDALQRVLINDPNDGDDYTYYWYDSVVYLYYDENGRAAVGAPLLNMALGYVVEVDGDELLLQKADSVKIEFDGDIENNFFYLLE